MFPSLPGPPASSDFLATVAIASLGLALAIVAFVLGVLRERARAPRRAGSTLAAARAKSGFLARPPAVRLALVALATVLLFGLVTQALWALLWIFPPSPAWLELDAPGPLPLLVWGLACLGPALMAAALAPSWSLAARHARRRRRPLRLEPALRRRLLRRLAVAAAGLGAVLDLLLLQRVANHLVSGAF